MFHRDNAQTYLDDIRKIEVLTPEEELHLAREVSKGELHAKQEMIRRNLRLVVKVARIYIQSGIQLDDLIEEGNLGLIRAVEKFDPEKGFKFSTYAVWWIRQSIELYLMNHSRTVRLPIRVIRKLKKHRGQSIDPNILLVNSGDRMMNETTMIVEQLLLDRIEDPNQPDPEVYLANQEIMINVLQSLDCLSKSHRKILARRYGVLGYEVATLEKIGEDIGVTRERVRQIQMSALKKLKAHLGSNSSLYLH